MSFLRERVDLSMKVFGGNIVDYYKNNTMYMYDLYRKSTEECESVSTIDMKVGGFYFLHYLDDSNWMMYAPIFCIDYRKLENMTIILGINFNFIPLEIRTAIFDKFISEKDFEENRVLRADFKGVYSELLRYGFEYSIVEFNASQIKRVHRISLELLPRFFYSSHPKNKYDPVKLLQIWSSKIETREKRHQEIMITTLNDLYKIESDVNEKIDVLKKHVDRLQKSFEKYGNK